jgi:hypothetical protein
MALAEIKTEKGRYELHVRHQNEEWLNLKLELRKPGRKGRREKRNWWLGWNGKRLARSSDAALLEKHEPEIYQWVIETLTAG